MKWLNRVTAVILATLFKRGKTYRESYRYWLNLGGGK